ncbi:PhzF family phenazine biosynthesis protein [Hornefia butyriciproducens]|jgi:PhzF family phenazine biosynthesis protein|uniref:PhzF family phenazine biosynthesis protein n=1 Tax=Hornefia butyriciproducens TaxID=2652293 RepID=A0A6L5Y857_9FIRM|nr:PhzF family phenazine biosynthesis protein [Hornefia butyriciproducens]MCI7328059.1 PhzF family phenazine biosynthesis protein [Clostridiales bacterium]MCI7412761.1 PhzF family phenazine biosynthesis protein [Clostridiales bacterium]MCI7679547.1 PhzF family phenazine biosynthesis protein [Clostridiales bacterium]MDD6300092.1 PhzF family phenazine biosynthesis protein [Hornefia butyriciproducens]MDD7020386.1 PhzF family phenazine biosynthesis protein [Hornefia butyriciproducens]
MKFQIVDAFTDTLFGGNPAGVVVIPDGKDYPEDEVMRRTAAELRYSETAFVKQEEDGVFRTRYFTPAAEVELCGHATIGSAYALMRFGMAQPGTVIRYETLAGAIDIVLREDSILMDMADPQAYGTIEGEEAVKELYRIMGIEAEGQGVWEKDPAVYLKPEKISTGLIDIMLPVKDEDELERINPDFPALTELSRRYDVVGVHAFTVNGKDGFIHARNFAPLYDIDEEAATGTSNGALAYYLYRYGILQPDTVNTVIQGEKMERPSRIATQIVLQDEQPKIRVGGLAVTLAEGEIDI